MNNIEFLHIDQYIHAYRVKGLHDFLLQKKNEFDKLWLNFKNKPNREVYNEVISDPNINKVLQPLLLKITHEYYMVDSKFRDFSLSLYSQTSDEYNSVYHNHYDSSTLTCTIYLNPPNQGEGGELSFLFTENDVFEILPEKDTIYFFPSWVMHKPLPQTSKEVRHCLNWGYNCSKRPIHKLTGDRW